MKEKIEEMAANRKYLKTSGEEKEKDEFEEEIKKNKFKKTKQNHSKKE